MYDKQVSSFLKSLKKKEKYVYKAYSQIFPALFQKEKGRISTSLKNALAIEHSGSTAIPNLGGKGIIDIAIAVVKEEMEHACDTLLSHMDRILVFDKGKIVEEGIHVALMCKDGLYSRMWNM